MKNRRRSCLNIHPKNCFAFCFDILCSSCYNQYVCLNIKYWAYSVCPGDISQLSPIRFFTMSSWVPFSCIQRNEDSHGHSPQKKYLAAIEAQARERIQGQSMISSNNSGQSSLLVCTCCAPVKNIIYIERLLLSFAPLSIYIHLEPIYTSALQVILKCSIAP